MDCEVDQYWSIFGENPSSQRHQFNVNATDLSIQVTTLSVSEIQHANCEINKNTVYNQVLVFPDYQIILMIRPQKCRPDPEREFRFNKTNLHIKNRFPCISVRIERGPE